MRDTPETIARERNARVQSRYDELMHEGKHGHYETLFRVVREEVEKDRAETIERCARVVDYGVRWEPPLGVPQEHVSREVAHLLAKSIRSLSTPPRAEP